jgi:opacity protein-like surface antigen
MRGDTLNLKAFATAIAVAAPLVVAGAAQAADNTASANTAPAFTPQVTLEIGYTRAQFSNTHPDFGLNTVELRGGYQPAKYWGAEMEGGFGLGSTSVSSEGYSVSVKQDWQVAFYGVGYLPVGHDVDLLARVGYGRTQATASLDDSSVAGQSSGAVAGVGVRQFPGGGKNGWRLDYTHYFYNSDPVDTVSVAYVRRF